MEWGYGRRCLAYVAGTALLGLAAACSGGGSGGGAPVALYEGPTSKAAVTSANAHVLLGALWQGPTAPPAVVKPGGAGPQAAIPLVRALRRVRDRTDSPRFKAARSKTPVDDTQAGAVSGTVHVTGTVEDDGTGSLTFVFDNYDDGTGDGVWDGELTLAALSYDPVLDTILETRLTIRLMRIHDADEDLSLSGTSGSVFDPVAGTETETDDQDAKDNLTGATARVADLVTVTDSTCGQTMRGRLYAEPYGYVDVSTDTRLTYATCSAEHPVGGGPLRMAGAAGSAAKATPLSPIRVKVEVDSDGDGTFEPAELYLWEDPAGASVVNTPPVAVIAGASSAEPGDTVALSGDASQDADGDFLTYAWTLVEVPAASAATLAGADTAHATLVPDTSGTYRVELVVDDGFEPSAPASLTITVTSPPELSLSPPDTTTYGEEVTFPATASDPDGDPVTLSILYGPIGMTVNATGTVHWTPSGPMFDREQVVHFAVRATAAGQSVSAAGSITVTDPARATPLTRTGIVVPSRPNNIHVADFDGDGANEILVTDNYQTVSTLVYDGSGYVQDWVHPFSLDPGSSIGGVTAYDVTGDGRPDIVAGARDRIVVIDGVTRRVVRDLPVDGVIREIQVADIDGDGAPEAVYLSSPNSFTGPYRIYVYDLAGGALEWDSSTIDVGPSLALGNVDADAALEIVTGGGFVFDGATHINEWTLGTGFGDTVDTGDLDGDGIDEIVGGDTGGNLRGFSAVTKAGVWAMNRSPAGVGIVRVADIDADPQAEILVADDQFGAVTALDGMDRSEQWSLRSLGYVSSLAAGDTDGDGALEFVWSDGVGSPAGTLEVAGLDPGIQIEWSNSDPVRLDGPFVGGRWLTTGPGRHEAVFMTPRTDSTYDGTRIVAVGADGAVTVSPEIDSNWSVARGLDAADYDGDGVDEVFLATAHLYDDYFAVYDFAAGVVWSSPVTPAGGTVVVQADVNGDGHADLVGLTLGRRIYVHDPFNQTYVWPGPAATVAVSDMAAADLDGDGVPEIVSAGAAGVTVHVRDATGFHVDRQAGFTDDLYVVALGDANGDGVRDIAVSGGNPLLREPSTVTVLDGVTLAVLGTFDMEQPVTALRFLPAGGAPQNLLVALQANPVTTPSTLETGTVVAVAPLTGDEIWRSPPLPGVIQPHSLTPADTNGDGTLELIYGTSAVMGMTR